MPPNGSSVSGKTHIDFLACTPGVLVGNFRAPPIPHLIHTKQTQHCVFLPMEGLQLPFSSAARLR